MKFVHISDVHLDMPLDFLKSNSKLFEERILEQRKAFKSVIDYIKKENIEFLFIAGDLYENEYVKKSTIEYVNDLFKTIPNTKIFISPGNHDPMIKNSYYDIFKFADNVKIFKEDKVEKVECDGIDIYGLGFKNFYMEKGALENFSLDKNDNVKILLMHGDLNGSEGEFSYNPISENELSSKGFDYVALGHIHNKIENGKIVYPGSLVSQGFDELGEHGMIVGNIKKNQVFYEFIKIDEREFVELEVLVNNMHSKEDFLDYINTLFLENNKFYKIILKGERKFLINTNELMKFIDNQYVLKIKDETVLGYDLEKITMENSLRGIYVRNLLEKFDKEFVSKDIVRRAIEIGLEAME